MIRHLVLWRLKADDAAGKADAVQAIAGALEPLVGVIDELISLKISPNVAYLDSNWDVALVADFASVGDLETYQVHPAHEAAGAVVRQHTAQRATVDFEV
ncbi:Dabb family protein [soil metagenome]